MTALLSFFFFFFPTHRFLAAKFHKFDKFQFFSLKLTDRFSFNLLCYLHVLFAVKYILRIRGKETYERCFLCVLKSLGKEKRQKSLAKTQTNYIFLHKSNMFQKCFLIVTMTTVSETKIPDVFLPEFSNVLLRDVLYQSFIAP